MRSRSWLLIGAAAVVTALPACSSSPTGPGGGSGIVGHVASYLFPELAAGGTTVASGDSLAVADANGNFSLNGIRAPYNLVARASGSYPTYTGYYMTSTVSPQLLGEAEEAPIFLPVRARAGDGLPPFNRPDAFLVDHATIGGSVSNTDGAGGTVWVVFGDGVRGATTSQSPGSPAVSYAGSFDWPRSPSRTVSVGALQKDSSGDFQYGETTDVTVMRDGSATVNVALNPVAGGKDTLEASYLYTGSLTITAPEWDFYVISGDLPVPVDKGVSDPATVELPRLANRTVVAIFSADYYDGPTQVGTVFTRVPDVDTSVPLEVEIPDPPALTGPDDSATGVGTDPLFAYTPSIGASVNYLFMNGIDPYMNSPQFWWVAADGDSLSMRVPQSAAMGATLHPDGQYQWQIVSVIGQEVTPADSQAMIAGLTDGPGIGDTTSLAHALRGPLIIVASSFRTFLVGTP